MQLQSDNKEYKHLIKSFSSGKIKINDIDYQKNLIITSDEIIENIRPTLFHELMLEDFAPILSLKPSILLIGTGEKHEFLNPSLMSFLLNHQMGVEVMTTRAAARTFNVLVSEGRNVNAILFLY